jgi:hypothetical protein
MSWLIDRGRYAIFLQTDHRQKHRSLQRDMVIDSPIIAQLHPDRVSQAKDLSHDPTDATNQD